MPTANVDPGNGVALQASAQVQNSKVWIIRDGGVYALGPAPGTAGVTLRSEMSLYVVNLPAVYIHFFLYPTYDDGVTTFNARTNLTFRPVFQMPPDEKPEANGFLTGSWLPASAPVVIPVGVPVTYRLCCAGWFNVSVEVGAGIPDPGQGQDQLLISISSSA